MFEFNDFSRCMDELEEDKRKYKASLEANNCNASELNHQVAELEKAKEKPRASSVLWLSSSPRV